MRKKRTPLPKERTSTEEEKSLPVSQLIGYLSRAAQLHNDVSTGNVKLSSGLRQLSKALRPHAHRSIGELAELLAERKSKSRRQITSKRIVATLPANLKSISHKEIESILCDENYNKNQLVELAVTRFGIPNAQLKRLKRGDVLESIRMAIDHERSLDVISQEARRGGESRST